MTFSYGLINHLKLIEAEWLIYESVNRTTLFQIMVCRLSGTKPLSALMLAFCYWNLRNNFIETSIEFHTLQLNKMCLIIASAKMRPSWLGLNVLTWQSALRHGRILLNNLFWQTSDMQSLPWINDWWYEQHSLPMSFLAPKLYSFNSIYFPERWLLVVVHGRWLCTSAGIV